MRIFIILLFTLNLTAFAQAPDVNFNPSSKKRVSKYKYSYVERGHTTRESLKLIGAVYGVSWAIYPLTQWDAFKNKGSWSNYKRNFGKIVFDQDEPFWNWFVHPISGSQLFLFYRANGYTKLQSLAMSFASSTLFEFTIETYTEPASLQDIYQTPIFGAILGFGIEKLSLYLLNTGNLFGKVVGHILNPATLFWFYDGKVLISPEFDGKGNSSITFTATF